MLEKQIKKRVTLCLWILQRSPNPLHSFMLPSLSSRHWGSKHQEEVTIDVVEEV